MIAQIETILLYLNASLATNQFLPEKEFTLLNHENFIYVFKKTVHGFEIPFFKYKLKKSKLILY